MTPIPAVLSLLAGLVALVCAAANLRTGIPPLPPEALASQRTTARVGAILAAVVVVMGPVFALAFPGYGLLDLTLIMTYGAVWTVDLAIQFAILHHIRVALEASP